MLRATSQLDAVALSHSSGWFGSAGFSFSAGAPSKARGPFVGVAVGVVCQGFGPFDGGDPDALGRPVLASPPED